MKRLFVDRYRESQNATLSKIWSPDDGELELYGLERKWLHNRSDVSCVPDGAYALVPWESPNHGSVWALVGGTVTPFKDDCPNDAGRWGNLFHSANYWHQLNGCLAPGMSSGYGSEGQIENELCVWNSRDAMKRLREFMGREGTAVVYIRWRLDA
jgi:hypothetical protein